MHNILCVPKGLLSEKSRASLLKRRALKLHDAESVAEALQIAEKLEPDLVLFSAQLEESGPLDFCNQIKAVVGLEHAKLLMITEQLDGAENLFSLPVDGHLVSPIDDGQLMRTIAGLLNVRLREVERVPVDLIARLDIMARDEEGDQQVMVNVINLSEGGMRIEAPIVLHEGALGRVQLFLPGSKERLTMYCVVRMLADEVLLHYGIELVGTKAGERRALREFVSSLTEHATDLGSLTI